MIDKDFINKVKNSKKILDELDKEFSQLNNERIKEPIILNSEIKPPEWVENIKSINNNTALNVKQNDEIINENRLLRKLYQESNLKLEEEQSKLKKEKIKVKIFSFIGFIAGAIITALIEKFIDLMF